MSTTVVEQPVEQKVVKVPSTVTEERISRMITMVREGRWCRDEMYTHDNNPRGCALGLARFVCQWE